MTPSIVRALVPAALALLVALPAQEAPAAKGGGKPAPKAPAKAAAPAKPAAQDEQAAPAAPDQALAARYARAMAPNERHAWLARLEGKWKTASRYTVRPGAPAVESVGTSEFKMLMDGRFLVENHDAAGGAGPFRGMGIMGFNVVTGAFERVWVDSNSTAMTVSQGEFDAQGDSVRWTDTWTDPATNARRELTSVLKWLDDRQLTFQQLDVVHGKDFKRLVVTYKKAD